MSSAHGDGTDLITGEPTWGGLSADPAFRFDGDDGGDADAPEADPDGAAWPDGLDPAAVAAGAFVLRGTGEQPAKCGTWQPRRFCSICGGVHLAESKCETRDCPACHAASVARSAESVTARLSGVRHAQDSAAEKRAVHVVVSAPSGAVTTVPEVWDSFGHVYDLAAQHGVRGGWAIFHGFRPTEECQREFRQIKELNEMLGGSVNMGIWDYIRFHGRPWRSLVRWAPHWHILGLSEDVAPNDPEGDDGWIVARLRSLEKYALTDAVDGSDGFSDTASVARYLIDHSTHESASTTPVSRWFGEAATASFSMSDLPASSARTIEKKAHEAVYGDGEGPDEESDETPRCDECGGPLEPIWDAGSALADPRWCEEIGRERQQRLSAAYRWSIGAAIPPPGLRHPSTEDEAEQALATLM
jgi:hypothetical protein